MSDIADLIYTSEPQLPFNLLGYRYGVSVAYDNHLEGSNQSWLMHAGCNLLKDL